MRIAVAVLAFLVAAAGDACTTFCTRGLFGRSYDFEIGYGMVVVNKRGVQRGAAGSQPAGAKWTSRHGSVTFNQFGRDFPTGGMNEKGLVVELMWLNGTRYPIADARPALGTLEWIQYQLDTAATVAEALENAQQVRIHEQGVPLHYLVADATGDVATIEFLDGHPVFRRGDSLPVPALANDTYDFSLGAMKRGSGDRFARVAKGLGTAMTIDGAFSLLDKVRQPSTQWQIVYDIKERAIHWRTAKNHENRSLQMAAFDFACGTPVKVLDIDRGRGDVASLFRDYTRAGNLALVRKSTRGTSFTRNTPDAEIEESAAWPERSRCGAADLGGVGVSR